MKILATNIGAEGMEIQGYPDGTIEITGIPVPSEETTVRKKVMSKSRSVTVNNAVAIRILEGLLKGDDIEYDLHLMRGDHGVTTKGDVIFVPPKLGAFNTMTVNVRFGVPYDDAYLVTADEAEEPVAKTLEIEERLESEYVNTSDADEAFTGISLDVVEEVELAARTDEFRDFCKPLEYTIEVYFRDFLIAMDNAL